MEINHIKKENEGELSLIENEKEIGHIKYTLDNDNNMRLIHTQIHENYHGKGFGKKIATKAFEWLKENNLKAKIECPFLIKFLEKNPEYQNCVL